MAELTLRELDELNVSRIKGVGEVKLRALQSIGVESVLDLVADSVARGETVKLSSFGSFSIRAKGQRIGRNPKTGEAVDIPAKRVAYFKPGKELKELINQA